MKCTEPCADIGLDTGGIQTTIGEQLFAAAVFDKRIRQADIQDVADDALLREVFIHGAARAAGQRIFLKRYQQIMGACQLAQAGLYPAV